MEEQLSVKVVDITMNICQVPLDYSIWTKFKTNSGSKYGIAVVYDYGYKNTGYLNIERYDHILMEDKIIRLQDDIVIVNEKWTFCRICLLRCIENANTLILLIFYQHAVQHHMIQFHSSLIDYKGKGILFLGPSGIGKTTQAELWNKYRDALIINGDIVFIQETKENFLGWGTPWHGSSPYCENTSVPVHAMIVLKQESENSIRELTGFEKVTAVSNNVFYPQWLENGMELCLETLDHLLSAIPVYELSCRPDEEAVRLTEETLFGN